MAAPPFIRLAPRSLSPLLLTCEHATNRLPVRRRGGQATWRILSSHWGWDIGGWAVARVLARRLGATAIGGRWTRLWIDLNRRVDDPTLILREVEGVTLPWNTALTHDEIERRIGACHTPYHAELDRQILRRRVRDLPVTAIAVHTFTPELHGRRREFDLGVLYTDHRSLARRVGEPLKRAGLAVRYNAPYSGLRGLMYAADRHGRHFEVPCLELELNQALFERAGAADRLAGILARVLAWLAS